MKVICVAGMTFGDEGKGLLTDFLVRESKAELVVRYNGGAQAAHNVISPEGVHHTFAQFGSGALAGARTFLSKYMLVDPLTLLVEQRILYPKVRGGVLAPMVDPDCVVVTPYHKYANRLRETARGASRHGSVGMGVGEARHDALQGLALRVGDTRDPSLCQSIMSRIRDKKLEEMFEIRGADPVLYGYMEGTLPQEYSRVFKEFSDYVKVCTLETAISGVRCAVFEGAQGLLLDQTYGFPPYNSWTDCTFGNAENLLAEIGIFPTDFLTVGVFRSYFTRHGPGPFVTEDPNICVAEKHNKVHAWMGDFRQGHFDMVMAEYACLMASPDVLAVTHMDCRPSDRVCESYSLGLSGLFPGVAAARTKQLLDSRPIYRLLSGEEFIPALEKVADCPVRYLGYGPCWTDMVKR